MKQNMILPALALLLGMLATACEKGELKPSASGNLVPKTVDENPALPALAINGTLFHAEAFGHPDSALIFVLHGGPGQDYRYLLENCQKLADDGFRVVFYDQRGSGLSKRHEKSVYSLDIMFDDLKAVIDHYKTGPAQKVFLLGHSWGAMLATAYINLHPQEIDGAILCEPGGFNYDDMIGYVKRSQAYSPFSETLNDVAYADQFITGREDDQEILDYKLTLWSSSDGKKDNPTGNEGPLSLWRAGAVVNEALFEIARRDGFDWTTNLNQFQTKVLFAYSQNNTAYGEEHARRVSAAYPNVQLLEVKDAGHDMLSFPRGWQNFHPVALQYLTELK